MSYAGLSQYNFIGTCQVSGFYVNRYKKFYVEYLGFWKYIWSGFRIEFQMKVREYF